MRRSYATHMMQADPSSLVRLAQNLGHKSYDTTAVYLRLSAVDRSNDKEPAEICRILCDRNLERLCNVQTPLSR